jgi:prolyl-tRNA editing enzyme YbaK/EbsC (Cys-tRNA(Pro) deacylase)
MMAEVLTSDDLQDFMTRRGIPGEILTLDVPTPTVEAAANALGVQTRQIVKSVLFKLPEDVVLTISCGDQLVERRVIASLYGISRKRVKLAPPDTVLALTGYMVGAVPPFGHRKALRTLMDPRVLALDVIYAGGGSAHALLRLNPQEIARITKAEIVDLQNKPASVESELDAQ